ncbi:hypothetical protein KAZ57_01860, partial [Patescibacteria group bacterium]|nr:hypothetical protein [Patescibacteria group bacterium]
VMLIKNSSGEPVRALKTNSLGQFAIGSPLGTGLYSVEADPSNVPGQTFDIITVEVKGEVIPPIEISGKNI